MTIHFASFHATKYFEKNYPEEMLLIKQIIKFELRGPGPLVVYVLLKLVIFMRKQKFLTQILARITITAKNITGGNIPRFPSPGPGHLKNLTKKMQGLNVFWNWPVIKQRES